MGTHPIFESDFDCLTECLAGSFCIHQISISIKNGKSGMMAFCRLPNVAEVLLFSMKKMSLLVNFFLGRKIAFSMAQTCVQKNIYCRLKEKLAGKNMFLNMNLSQKSLCRKSQRNLGNQDLVAIVWPLTRL